MAVIPLNTHDHQPIRLCRSEIVSITEIAWETFVLRLKEPALSQNAHPGQFVEIRVPRCADILWRRPFSIHDADGEAETIDILFHAVGRGTEALKHLQVGDVLDLLGPLGNSFHIDDHLTEAIIVAGGLGIAPFKLFLRKTRQRNVPTTLFYGVGKKEQLCRLDDFQPSAQVRVSSVDGSVGSRGMVTDLLIEHLRTVPDMERKCLFVCGPTPMLRKVQEIAAQFQIKAQVSVETIMACGFGVCVGCAVPMRFPDPGKKEYFLACKEGPVFNMEEIIIHD